MVSTEWYLMFIELVKPRAELIIKLIRNYFEEIMALVVLPLALSIVVFPLLYIIFPKVISNNSTSLLAFVLFLISF